MGSFSVLVITIAAYVLLARWSLSISSYRLKSVVFATINLAAFLWLIVITAAPEPDNTVAAAVWFKSIAPYVACGGGYILVVVFSFILMTRFSKRTSRSFWLAFLFPIIILIAVKYFSFIWSPLLGKAGLSYSIVTATVVGLSYMAFRLSYLALEVRNGVVRSPLIGEYLGFAFFIPTLVVGPINHFSAHQRSFAHFDRSLMPVGRCLLRILVGLTKYQFLGNLANQLSYSGVFLDLKPHGFFDLGVSMVFYYLYLYCNFSGFCDIGIGVAGLIGIHVKENFNNPFAAKNVKDFWNRWHITLSDYVRNVIFSPLSKALIQRLGVQYSNLCIAISILVTFLVVGVWHGVGWRFAAFGLIHAFGIIVNHYYTLWLKRRLGKHRYKAYNEHSLVNWLATVVTFGYVAASFSVFANDYAMMKVIGHGLLDGLRVR